MKRRFSDGDLFKLRNYVSIEMLIKEKLDMPSKISDGFFRFLCPVCNEFQTSINASINLSRCFRCKRNFNTIDLVMMVKDMKFIDAVKYLQKMPQKPPDAPPKAPQALKQMLDNIGKPVDVAAAG